jgi:hypothetical protein
MVVFVRIGTYRVAIRALHIPDEVQAHWFGIQECGEHIPPVRIVQDKVYRSALGFF